MHEWMLDNGYTPCLVVDAQRPGVLVPASHVKEGKIVLNISPTATRGLVLANDTVTFETRFGGVSQRLVIPMDAVLGIYARETGQSMIFGEAAPATTEGAEAPPQAVEPPPDGDKPPPGPSGGRRAKLKVIK
jgi:stringent starvation protein B